LPFGSNCVSSGYEVLATSVTYAPVAEPTLAAPVTGGAAVTVHVAAV